MSTFMTPLITTPTNEMTLLDEAKAIAKQLKVEKVKATANVKISPMQAFMNNPESKKVAKIIMKSGASKKVALDAFNELMKSRNELPTNKNGKSISIGLYRFNKLAGSAKGIKKTKNSKNSENSLTNADEKFLERYSKLGAEEEELSMIEEQYDREISDCNDFRGKKQAQKNKILKENNATSEEYLYGLFSEYKNYIKLSINVKRLKTLQNKKTPEQIEAEYQKYERILRSIDEINSKVF